MDTELTKDLFNGLRNRNRNRTLQNDSFLNKNEVISQRNITQA